MSDFSCFPAGWQSIIRGPALGVAASFGVTDTRALPREFMERYGDRIAGSSGMSLKVVQQLVAHLDSPQLVTGGSERLIDYVLNNLDQLAPGEGDMGGGAE